VGASVFRVLELACGTPLCNWGKNNELNTKQNFKNISLIQGVVNTNSKTAIFLSERYNFSNDDVEEID